MILLLLHIYFLKILYIYELKTKFLDDIPQLFNLINNANFLNSYLS